MNQENKTPHSFCETPEEKCTMNYCDENGCQNRKRHLVEENKQLPTAYDELGFALTSLRLEVDASIVNRLQDLKVKAFEEKTKPLREELEKLRADKESLLVRVEEVREINKQLEHEMLLVKRNNKDLKAENERLKSTPGNTQVILAEGYNRLDAENQKLREALERIKNLQPALRPFSEYAYIEEIRHIAKEALKGLGQ